MNGGFQFGPKSVFSSYFSWTTLGTKDNSDSAKHRNRKRSTLRKALKVNRKKEHGTIGVNAMKKKLRKAIVRYTPVNNIVNLGTTALTEGETKLLQKGLSFVPTPARIPQEDIMKSLNEFIRRMKLQFHFFSPPNAQKQWTIQNSIHLGPTG